ncbi:MAG: hypothetical protein GTO13_14295 [Proteobacteria bacterium]|nr:hypothetical protein [Pseudomonadota bacterium]
MSRPGPESCHLASLVVRRQEGRAMNPENLLLPLTKYALVPVIAELHTPA